MNQYLLLKCFYIHKKILLNYDNFKLPKQINTKIIAEAESLVIFCDCELQGHVQLGSVKVNQPITYILNIV